MDFLKVTRAFTGKLEEIAVMKQLIMAWDREKQTFGLKFCDSHRSTGFESVKAT